MAGPRSGRPASSAGPCYREVLPVLLTPRAGLEEIDRSLEALSDGEIDAVIERARLRAGSLGGEAVAAISDEAVRAARAHGRS